MGSDEFRGAPVGRLPQTMADQRVDDDVGLVSGERRQLDFSSACRVDEERLERVRRVVNGDPILAVERDPVITS